MSKAADLQHGVGKTGVFGEIFIALGLLIGIFGAVFWGLAEFGYFDDSIVGPVAAHADALALGFLFLVEGLGFCVFGVMILVSAWDRHHHPDPVH